MPQLSPTEAAVIADSVYQVLEDSLEESLSRGRRFGTEGKFKLLGGKQLDGKSGALLWKQLSGFGYIAWGENQHEHELLVAIRGTDLNVDWLTNFHIGMRPGPGGMGVHTGFHDTWKSFAPELSKFVRGRNPTHVHCVGHSLGGALAALTADWVSANRVAGATLYTFGAPRCGDVLFAQQLTQRLGAEHIHRVYHPADVVPMIPMFPFLHAPLPGSGLVLPTGSGALFSKDAHNMPESYKPGVEGRTWQGLRTGRGTGLNDGVEIPNWLEAAASGKGAVLMGSASVLSMIGRALAWLVRKAAWVIGSALGAPVTLGMTLVDQLAWVLGHAAQASKEIGVQLGLLMRSILGFMGRKVVMGTVEVTVAFVRWLLASLLATLTNIARNALGRLR